ncbi:MAG TPA: TRAP transporter large permease subunit, partial [Candidatus Methylomirabilis sp.]|nr:TRAP transporter large permease subunit [Candidatus Methylomirabilis sp.]
LVSVAVATSLLWASLQFVRAEMESPAIVAGWIPIWAAQAILPAAFAVILLRLVAEAGAWQARLLASLGIVAAVVIGFPLAAYAGQFRWVLITALIAAAILGAPIFVVLGGAALVLFLADGVQVASIPVETYRIMVSPLIPTIPLFTLAGYLLAEGGASRRLVRLFRALFGWMPGGLAIAATLVCGFFTTFTGASGVTILAVGGLLLPTLLQNGYPERFSVGLLTGTGSIGLLFPPSLAVILYAVVARIPIPDLFKASILPGIIMVSVVCLSGVREAFRSKVPRPAFDLREAAAAVWASRWDILLPIIAFVGIFGGFTTLIEAAAVTVVYALMVETVIYRDLHVTRDLPRVLIKCVTLIGGVFIILGVAMGLTNYLVDAEVPAKAALWVQGNIQSRVLFLLTLNIFLLIVGCLMDIFSAIVVVVPLILPISRVFNIDPLHLGVIFLANLELGYLTPPVGMNLFLASYRFERPLVEVYRYALPFLLILAAVVLLITYVPSLTLGLG